MVCTYSHTMCDHLVMWRRMQWRHWRQCSSWSSARPPEVLPADTCTQQCHGTWWRRCGPSSSATSQPPSARCGAGVVTHACQGIDGAFLPLVQSIQVAIDTPSPQPYLWDKAGHLIVRLGIDGTTRFHQGIEVVVVVGPLTLQVFTLSVRAGHDPGDFQPIGYFVGHERFQHMGLFIGQTGWEKELDDMGQVVVAGHQRQVRVFITGDHQLRVRMRDCGATTAKEGRCPYCDIPSGVCISEKQCVGHGELGMGCGTSGG